MLTYNVDTLDSLANGALGEVIGFETSSNKTVKSILVQFENVKVGQQKRKQNSRSLQEKFPNIPVTPIAKIECRFHLSKNPTSQNDFMLATQFPLKVAFASTAHKIQGSTIKAPKQLIADLKSVREAAQGYVILSRVQKLDQLFILNEFPKDKIYPSNTAMEELQRLQELAENDISNRQEVLISSMNIRSLMKHHQDIENNAKIRSSVIALQETWCDGGHTNDNFPLQGYNLQLVSQGHGKGVAVYFRTGFVVAGIFNKELYQMVKVACDEFDVINVYRSKNANKSEFLKDLGCLARGTKACYIVGDFNIDFSVEPKDFVIRTILSNGFSQIVTTPTHLQGGLIDHVFCKNVSFEPQVRLSHCYYSDHALISVCKPI